MSWWIGVEIDTGSGEPVVLTERNVTYNVAPMFHEALAIPSPGVHDGDRYCRCRYQNSDGEHERGLRALNSAPCTEAAGVISAALERMRAEPAKYQAMNPSNGWGSYESAKDDLLWLLTACQVHPRASVYVH